MEELLQCANSGTSQLPLCVYMRECVRMYVCEYYGCACVSELCELCLRVSIKFLAQVSDI